MHRGGTCIINAAMLLLCHNALQYICITTTFPRHRNYTYWRLWHVWYYNRLQYTLSWNIPRPAMPHILQYLWCYNTIIHLYRNWPLWSVCWSLLTHMACLQLWARHNGAWEHMIPFTINLYDVLFHTLHIYFIPSW